MRSFRVPFLGVNVTLMKKDESALVFLPELRGRLMRGPNSPSIWGKRELNLGVLSRRVVTNAGVAFLVDDWDDSTTDITNFNAHASGTGAVAEAVGDTSLGTEIGTRQTGTKSQPTANQIRSVATLSYTGANAITEHGLFDSTTVAGSTLWDRSVFAAINVQNGDSIEFTYTLTVNAGG